MKKKLSIFKWFEHIYNLIAAALQIIFSSLAWFRGIQPRGSAAAHENIQLTDVNDVRKEAVEQQQAIDAISADMTPAQTVEAYCRATEEGRMSMNLGKLSIEQQCWLLRLTDAELVMLGNSGTAACARSLAALKVLPSFRRIRASETEEAPEVLPGPEIDVEELKQIQIRERYRDLFWKLSNPDAYPGRPTVH